MIKTIEHNGNYYPHFQAEGNAAQFAIPFAKHFCRGNGVDVGCNREEWKFPNAIAADPAMETEFDALHLPKNLDYIFSSHCLEHLEDWVHVLEYWKTCLKDHGVLFLYLPHYDQTYWRPWHNRKHLHIFSPQIMKDCLTDMGFKNIFVSERDLNNAFMIVGEKS